MLQEFANAQPVLSALSSTLPQPDQLCGPFSAAVAIAGVLGDAAPSLVDLALASGSSTWPQEIPGARPPGVPVLREGWETLPTAESAGAAGTNAAGLASGIERASAGRVSVVPVASPPAEPLRRLLLGLCSTRLRFGLVANVRTRFLTESNWDVGHFVTVWGFDEDADEAAIADTYEELGSPGLPPACRMVTASALADSMAADGGRGLLLLVSSSSLDDARALVDALGLDRRLWDT